MMLQMNDNVSNNRGTDTEPVTRVAFSVYYVTHYRIPFFRQLAQMPAFEFLLIHGAGEAGTARPRAEIGSLGKGASTCVQNRSWSLGPFCVRWQSGVLPIVRRFKPEVIVISGISGTISNWLLLLWARARGIDSILWVCGWEAQTPGTVAYYVKRFLLKRYYLLARRIIVYSSTARDDLSALGIPADRCIICYNGLDITEDACTSEHIESAAAELRTHLESADMPLFLYVGGFMPEKRVDLLLRAFSRLPSSSATLWLIGDGPDLPLAQDLATRLKIGNVRFWNRITEDVDRFFAAADFFVLPGVGGLALNQAMIRGTPCICSTADGTERDLIVNGQTGFSFLPNDEDSLLAAMYKALLIRSSDEDYAKMASAARQLIISQSNVNIMVNTFADVLYQAGRK